MEQLENKLNELLVTKMSLKLPEGGKKFLVQAMPWLVLIGAILAVLAGLGSFMAIMALNSAMYGLGSVGYAVTYGTNYNLILWLGVIMLAVQAVIGFMAFSPLKERKKKGWNLIFWTDLLYIVYALVNAVLSANIGSFILSLVFSVIGLYLLFQIRGAYTASAAK